MQRLGKWDLLIGVLLLVLTGLDQFYWEGTNLVLIATVAGVVLLIRIYLILAGWLLARVIFRVALALVPLVALATVVIGQVILPNESLKDVHPALIAGTMLATGWLATFLANEYQRTRERERTRRDVLLALRSEIFTIVEKIDKDDICASGNSVQAKITQGGDADGNYFPFSASESPPIIYQAVSGSIAVLSAETLEPMVRFYAAYSDLTAMVEDTRNEEFKSLSFERRIALHKDLVKNRTATLGWGLAAVKAANLALGVPNPGGIGRSGENPCVIAVDINSEGRT